MCRGDIEDCEAPRLNLGYSFSTATRWLYWRVLGAHLSGQIIPIMKKWYNSLGVVPLLTALLGTPKPYDFGQVAP